jgi:hypothetical protein
MNKTNEMPLGKHPDKIIRGLILACLAQAAIVLVAGLNLEMKLTKQLVLGIPFVRLREMISLLVVVPATVATTFNILWILENGRKDAKWPITLFLVSVCLLGISMGVHEPVNALPPLSIKLAPAMHFWDEQFSHAVFYVAYVGCSASLLWSQARNPLSSAMCMRDTVTFSIVAVLAGTGILLTLLSGGNIRIDLAVIMLTLGVAELLRKRLPFRNLPIALAVEGAYFLTFLGLIIHRLFL